jgi:hypothetical protein
LVYLLVLLIPNSYTVLFWELFFLPFSVHAQTNVIYVALSPLLWCFFNNCIYYYYYFLWLCSPAWAMASSSTRFLDHTQRRTTVGRTPLDEWSARRRDLYLTTHNTQQTNIHAPWWDSNPRSQQASGRRPTP